MEITAKCKFDFETIKALTHLAVFKKSNPKKQFILITILDTIAIVLSLLEIILFSAPFGWIFPCTIFMLLFINYIYFLLPKVRYKALAKMKTAENEYIFYDNSFKIFAKNEVYNGEADIEYSLLVCAYETSKYFFLYQTNNQAFIVDKSTLVGGTAEEIKSKLSYFLKNKYFVCRY